MTTEATLIPAIRSGAKLAELVPIVKGAQIGAKGVVNVSTKTANKIDEAFARGTHIKLGEEQYTYVGNGQFIGPNGGKVINTGETDVLTGNHIYRRMAPDGSLSNAFYMMSADGKQIKVDRFGNLLSIDKLTTSAIPVQKNTGDRYGWIDNYRTPNAEPVFLGNSKYYSNNDYFKSSAQWQAPSKGTGLKYTVYQQEIDLNFKPFTNDGDFITTNADLMQNGNAPYVIKNGIPEQIQLHHSKQNGRGVIFEITESSHLRHTNYDGRRALHPYSSQHPDFPVNRKLFDIDQSNYWLSRVKSLNGE